MSSDKRSSAQGFNELRRAHYRANGLQRAAQQEAEESENRYSRQSFHPDALSQATRQEVRETRREMRQGQNTPTASREPRTRRRPQSVPLVHAASERGVRADEPQTAPVSGGGAVISKRRRMPQRRRTGERKAARQGGARNHASVGMSGSTRRFPAIIAALLAVVVVLYLVMCKPIDDAIAFSPQESQGLSQELSWRIPCTPYYVLALGSDARPEDTVSRTDTMILVRVDPLAAKLTMISIPRDTYVEIDGYGPQKINAAYAFGGTAGAVRAVKELTGISVAEVAVVHFDGVETLVNAIGGVTVDVPVDVYDPDYTGLILPAGVQEMDGHTALLFSRVRHGFALGDYQRQANQRLVLQAIMAKTLSMSPTAMPGVVGSMGELLGTSMRMYSILPLMLRLKLAGSPTVYSATLPSEPIDIGGISYVQVNEAAMREMLARVDAGQDPAGEAA